MGQQVIAIEKTFNAPVERVFAALSNHEEFGKIVGVRMQRIKAGDEIENGIGSVRKLNIGPLPSFDETITKFIPNQLIEYRVSRGSPIKNHLGQLKFTPENGKTRLEYTITFEPKIPFTGAILKKALQDGISKGLKNYASSL